MSVFLIDYENVHAAGLLGVDRLTENDKVYIFYSVNSNSINFEAYKLLKASKAEIIPLLASCGMKNALDFQLASFMGYLAGVSEDRDLFVISLDKGYSFVQTFWEKTMQCTNFNIRFAPHIRKCLAPETIGVINTAGTDRAVFGARPQGSIEEMAAASASPALPAADISGEKFFPAGADMTDGNTAAGEGIVSGNIEAMPEVTGAADSENSVSENISGACEDIAAEKAAVTGENVPVENKAVSDENIVPEDAADKNKHAVQTGNVRENNVANAAKSTPEKASGNNMADILTDSEEPEVLQAAVTETASLSDKAVEKTESAGTDSDENPAAAKAVLPLQPETENTKAADLIEWAGVDRVHAGVICGLVISSRDKQQFYTGMTKAFGMENGRKIYTSIKGEYAGLKMLLAGEDAAPPKPAPAKKTPGRKKTDSANIKQGKSRITDIVSRAGIKNVKTSVICDMVTESKDKQQFYTGMTKAFGMEAGLKIYKSLKPEYLNLKKLLQAT